MLRRRRSATALAERVENRQETPSGPTHRIRLVPHLESHRSLHFEAISRDVRQGEPPLRIGRFTDRSTHSGANGTKLAFKSKVVSRGHAEVWFDSGSFYIKDTKSSSGTFLNHIRLSSPNTESRPYPIKDGDVLQLGVDYQGGTEEIYRCVKMRVELGREWQSGVNAFNSNALMQLKTLSRVAQPEVKAVPAEKRTKSNLTDCCICLFQVTVCQSLFIAPCSHVYHYKCIRPLLEMHHPGFSCPLCRTFADLEADVEVEHRDPDPGALDNVDMGLEDVHAESHAQGELESRVPEPRDVDPDPDVEDTEDADGDRTSSSLSSSGAAIDTDPTPASIPIPVPRQDSGDVSGFPGAETTPLNSTFLATLALSTEEGNTTGTGAGTGLNVPTRGTELDAASLSEGESGEEGISGVGGKRKR
ncbi:hypothetical protein JB92DRAFT_2688598 [Gautieria morchelliformis]|nr:hypothetical protein JB92DRAFT_2688598 [Gautieria morchelliformis]